MIRRILAAAGGYGLLSFALLANLAEGYARARIASDGGNMLDAAIAHNFLLMRENFILIILFILLLALGIFIKDSLLGQYLEKGMLRLRKKTLESIGEAEMSWLDSFHTGKLSARVMADLNALSGALRPVLIMGISIAIYQIVCIVFMFMTNWLLTLIVFAIVPLTVFLQWVSSNPIRSYRRANQNAVGELSSVIFDCFGSFESVKSLALEDEMKKRFNTAQEKQVSASINESRITAFLELISGFGRYLPQLILILFGGYFVINSSVYPFSLTLGQLTMFLALSSGVIRTIGNLGSLISSIRQLGVNVERITELWDAPKEKSGSAALKTNKNDVLIFDKVSFAYGITGNGNIKEKDRVPGELALDDISFIVEQGSFTALVGESGSGKSTAMKLASSLYSPIKGDINLLGNNIKEWDLIKLRSLISYVSQDTYLFPGSIRENIIAGGSDENGKSPRELYNDEYLYECLDAAALLDFIKTLPQGLDTEAGERGIFLSGGQRQRISIARALYRKAEVLFLDEATSALDLSTEEAVLTGIKKFYNKNNLPLTLIAITHNLKNVRNADSILVFKNGKICEKGKHGELIAYNGEYAQLLERQREGGASPA